MKLPTSAALLIALFAVLPSARAAADGSASGAFDVNAALGQQWKEKLGFTGGQSEKYAAAEKRKEDALRPLRRNLREALQELGNLLSANAPDKAVLAALDAFTHARNAVADANMRFDDDLASFLTPTQRAKMLVGMPLGEIKTEGAADKRTANMHEALTDGDLEQE